MRALALILICPLLSPGVAAKDAAGLFDKPLKTVRIPLPADPLNPQAKPAISCVYFKDFAVKQIDRGEVGAELSIVPLAAGAKNYKCREEAAAGEFAGGAKEWSGYFKGVKGGHVFLDAADGRNGGVGFAIFDSADGKKLFDDTAKGLHAVELTPSGLTLRYTRVYDAGCSLYADPAGCWAKVRQGTGVAQTTPPDCAAPYKAEEKRMKGTPNEAKVASLPSALDYEVKVLISSGEAKVVALPGKVTCRLPE